MLVATHNLGKLREFRSLLAGLDQDVLGLEDARISVEVVEDGTTFAENALLKARTIARLSGVVTLADDSGLEVDALHSRPGVYSARYGGPQASDRDRCLLILQELSDAPEQLRRARFRCALAVVWPDGRTALTTGTCEGQISRELRGTDGFGYDPIFYVPEHGCTMAQLPQEEKNRISHRARAAQAMVTLLRRLSL
ncbi:MAG: XTP/dITP diphosphatase [Anaerolineae bacterium]|jgi:XTP/dITP diphosphohydrolase|nr:XTP/dITP diphosphatase [Chloroflexota bacterium]